MHRVGKRIAFAVVVVLVPLFLWLAHLTAEGSKEERAVERMVFPIALSATSVRGAYPEVRSLALSIRDDFFLTRVIYHLPGQEAMFRFQAPGRPYRGDNLTLRFRVDTSAWVISTGDVSYGSVQTRFSPSDLELTTLDVLDVLAIAADAGAPRVVPVRVSWQAECWLVWYPDRLIKVAISSEGEVFRVDRP
ncbi:MAG: hypothetical protein AB1492_02225 [Bacillota bacterium]